jgi:hypothetical protein
VQVVGEQIVDLAEREVSLFLARINQLFDIVKFVVESQAYNPKSGAPSGGCVRGNRHCGGIGTVSTDTGRNLRILSPLQPTIQPELHVLRAV